MKADPVLRWALNSRNKVVKQGDLATLSESHVSVIVNYFDEAKIIRHERQLWDQLAGEPLSESGIEYTDQPVHMAVGEILESLHLECLPLSEKQRASVYFERRWVDDSLPDYEVMTALAYCFGKLHQVIERAHSVGDTESNHKNYTNRENREHSSNFLSSGRLPCMVTTRPFRSLRRRYLDGTEVSDYQSATVKPDPVAFQETIEKQPYGPLPAFPAAKIGNAQETEQLKCLLSVYEESAKGILRSGEDHGWFTYYYKSGVVVDSRIHTAMDAQGKKAVAGQIAHTALACDADAVIMINEVWISEEKLTKDGAFYPPSVDPERKEAVLIDGIAKSGAKATIIVPFDVIDGEPPHRKVRIRSGSDYSFDMILMFAPLMEAWDLAGTKRGIEFWRAQMAAKKNSCKPSAG